MKILLLSVNRERSPYPVFPLGLSYLAAPLRAAGHELAVLDLCFEKDSETATCEKLASFLPDLVVISLRNIDNVTWPNSRSYLDGVRFVADNCRKYAPVILGGSGFSLMPTEIMIFLDADYGLVGEGEELLPELLELIEQGGDPAGLPGVLVRGSHVYQPQKPIERIGTPDRSLFDVARYHRDGGMTNVQTKRGCPFACVYCTYPLLEGRRMRLRPVAEIISELRSLVAEYGASYVYFVDDIFNYPPEFAKELCLAMAAGKLQIKWTAFINPAFISPGLLEVMIAAGCDAVEFGTESGSPLMLNNLGKSFTVDDVRSASILCREHDLDFAHYILFGGPGETIETILETFALMDELQPTAVIAMNGIRIYPGTPLHSTALAEGIVDRETNLLEPVFYISPLVRDSLSELVTSQAVSRKNWVVPGFEVNISDAMLDALRMFPVKGPLWKLIKRSGKSRIKPM